MKILILSEYFGSYKDKASYEIRYLTAKKLSEKGNAVVFVSPSNYSALFSKKHIVGNLTIIFSPGLFPIFLRTGGFSFLDTLYKIFVVLMYHFDVVQVTNGHRPANFFPSLFAKFLKNIKIVDECWEWLGKTGYSDIRKGFTGKLISLYDNLFELKLKNIYDHVITITNTLKNRFKNSTNVTVIHGGSLNKSLKPYNIIDARNSISINLESFIIGMSNISSSDHDDNSIVFKAFDLLCRDYPNFYLIFTGSDNNYIEHIKSIYSFSNRIICPGWVEFDLYNRFLSSCNIFILPLKNTIINKARWPNKISDYFCLNRPVLTNPVGDIQSILTQYKVGLLCDASANSFYNMLKDILDSKINIVEYSKDCLYVSNKILSFESRIREFIRIFKFLISK